MDRALSADEIKALRVQLGMTQQEFAVRLGTTVPTVSRWENGAREPRGLYKRALADLKRSAEEG